MHASTIISTLLLALGVFATPVPVPDTSDNTPHLFRRSNSCQTDGSAVRGWKISVDRDTYYNGACGSGCLDNIRGRCGTVTSWGCERDAAGTGFYHFYTTSGCTEWAMTQALKACTKGEQTIDCERVSTPL